MSTTGDEHIDLGAYALGLLEDRDKASFEAHLATCPACAGELGMLSPVAGLLRGLEPVELPADPGAGELPVDLLRRRAAVSRRRFRWQVAVGAAACVAAPGDGVPGHPAHLLVQGGTAIPIDNLARFEVTVVRGPTLLTIRV